MRGRPRTPLPPLDDSTLEIARLRHQLAGLTQHWQTVAPPPSLAEAVEELTSTVEELHAVNAELTVAQQVAHASQQRYQELFDGVPDAYLVTDLQGVIQEANRAAAALFHVNRAQLPGLPLAAFVARDMRPAFRAQLSWLGNGAEVPEWVLRVQPRHRPAVPVVCQVAPAWEFGGRVTGLRWLLRDLTAQQQAQETFERRVRELTQAIEATQAQAEARGRELHHRLKKNFQVIASLLDMHADASPAPPRARRAGGVPIAPPGHGAHP